MPAATVGGSPTRRFVKSDEQVVRLPVFGSAQAWRPTATNGDALYDGFSVTCFRRLLVAPLLAVAFLLWAGVPNLIAAGAALDHPGWSGPDVDQPAGRPAIDERSWWPPGRRYEWIGPRSGATIERIDPWNPTVLGHVWTGALVAATLLLSWWSWTGCRPLRWLRFLNLEI
jgi:hypothetical protein